jgi:Flp pilus assembly protein TadD/SAM-dependent methyltransferase
MSDSAARLEAALKRHRGGDLVGAMASYRTILAEAPAEPDALHLLGVATLQSGDAAGAADLIAQAIAVRPDVAKYHVNLGEARRLLGEFDSAIACYRRAIALEPGNAAARNNLGATLLRLGHAVEAREALQDAARVAPEDAQTQANLGQARWRLGEIVPALEALGNATLLAPQQLGYRQLLVRVARDMPTVNLPPAVWKQLLDCFAVPGVDVQPLARPLTAVARRTPEFAELMRLAELPVEQARRGLADGGDLLASRLVCDILFHTLVSDPLFEAVLVRLRRILLAEAMDASRGPDSGVLGAQPLFVAGLAAQAYINGFLWPAEASERADVAALAQRLAEDAVLGRLTAGDKPALQRFLAVAAYRPLSGPGAEALQGVAGVIELAADRFQPRLRELVKREITAAKQEAEFTRTLPGSAGAGALSGARWQTLNKLPPVTLAERMGALFPGLAARPVAGRALFAGCGTGKAAIELAAQLADARVIAIDDNRADLAFARLKAREHGVGSISFRVGGVEALGGEDRFDLIEALRAVDLARLVAALVPGGLIKLVLPSPRRAAALAAAQAHLVSAGTAPPDLAAARAAILTLPPGHPAREIADWEGFYAAPSARSLLFDPPAASVDLLSAKALVADAGLDWLGLQRDERIVEAVGEADLTLQAWARKPA